MKLDEKGIDAAIVAASTAANEYQVRDIITAYLQAAGADHIGDANKMVNGCGASLAPAVPGEEEIRRIIDEALASAIPEPWEVSDYATRRILDLFAPVIAEKERLSECLRVARIEADQMRETSIQNARERNAAEAALAKAKEEERERCARIAEDPAHTLHLRSRATIASAIRAKGEHDVD